MSSESITRYTMSEDDRIRENARMREKMAFDEASALFNAEQKGIEKGIVMGKAEGISEGIAQRNQDLFFKFRSMGMPDDEINRLLS
ncbi:MAG: hypothetical protein NC078_00205 [Ruminococcus sp.]|nr:hypothetical protein [Ruminococcus sp.]